MDTLKIQHISDDTQYLDSIGRRKIAEIIKTAEVSESDAEREAAQIEADAAGQAEIANQVAQKAILEAQNEMRRIVADLEAQAKSEEERTVAAAQTARALAEQELQRIRSELEQRRLDVDVVAPAEAEKNAKEILAKGKAAYTAEQGKATASVLDMMNKVWAEAGHRAKEIYLIQHLETIIAAVVDSVRQVQVKNVNLLDNGDGGSLPAYVGAYPAIVTGVLKELRNATGIDVPEILTGTSPGGTKPQTPSLGRP
jgi:flotillin